MTGRTGLRQATTRASTESELVSVRPAVEQDIDPIRCIYAHHVLNGTGSFEESAPDVEEMAARFRSVRERDLPFLVAEIEGVVRGFAYAAPFRSRSAYRFTVEDSVYVHPAAVGRGIGRQLLAGLIERCRKKGLRQMVAVIGDSDNERSIALHAALGFRRAGTLLQVGCKFGRSLDIVFMQRPLSDDPASP